MITEYSILLLENPDDPLHSLFYSFIQRYKVFRTDTPEQAMDILAKNSIDMVIADNDIYKTTGVVFFRKLHTLYPVMGKILIVTAKHNFKDIMDAHAQGIIDKFIFRPFAVDQISNLVFDVLNLHLKRMIAQRKQLESQMVQNSKLAAIGELVAGVAHEINNPLGYIHANLDNLNKFHKKIIGLIDKYDQEISQEVREEIEKEREAINYSYLKYRMASMIERSIAGVERIENIIGDLKLFSRLDRAECSDNDIHEGIDSTLGILYSQYKNRIEIIKEYGNIPLFYCNSSKLNQVFMNLLVNACHAIADKGKIRIKTGMENETVKIEISDTGSGIPEKIIDNIFDPFFTTKPVGKGTGLGLSISYGIIKEHKGTLTAKSKLGEGSRFIIKIPIQKGDDNDK